MGSLAQLVEHRTFNPMVERSNRSRPTIYIYIYIKAYIDCRSFFRLLKNTGVIQRAVQAAIATARPGVMAKEVDAAARDVITEAGYGEFFVHRLGHGLGIDIHEPPYITATSEVILDEGMVFSIEPGIYLQGRFGVRLEEIVILRADGPEILSELSRKLNIIK